MGVGIDALVAQRAWLIDQILLSAWREAGLDPGRFALLAVGGYGRGELHPGSDVDVAIVTGRETLDEEHQRIAGYVRFLWDIGLDIGHSVRTVEDCETEAGSDITVMTNLMEARLLSGSPALYRGMREATAPDRIWPPAAFFEAKLAEQTARHARFHGTAHNLEPNIKEGPGGLRDIHTIAWVAKRQFGAESLRGLLDHGFLSEDEQRVLDRRPVLPVARTLRPAPARGPPRGPAAVRLPAPCRGALRVWRPGGRAARRRAFHEALLPHGDGAPATERDAPAVVSGGDPGISAGGPDRAAQQALPGPQRLPRRLSRSGLRALPLCPARGVPAPPATPRDRRRTRQHHPLNPRPPSSHRRQVPQEPQVARVVHGDHPPAAWHRP